MTGNRIRVVLLILGLPIAILGSLVITSLWGAAYVNAIIVAVIGFAFGTPWAREQARKQGRGFWPWDR
jgi:hypothetical protein